MPVNGKKQMLWDGALFAGILLCAVGLLWYSRPVSTAITQSLTLCLQVLLPSLFPFFVLSGMLIASGAVQRLSSCLEKPFRKLFDLPGCSSAALLLGALGGYPVGARTAASLYSQGLCGQWDAEKMLCFCNNAGPAFLIGVLGSKLLQDPALGTQLFVIHLVSALLVGLLLPKKKTAVKLNDFSSFGNTPQPFYILFLDAVTGAFTSYLSVCSFVLIFSVLLCLFSQISAFTVLSSMLPGDSTLWNGIFSGVLELTTGAACLTSASLPRTVLLPALSFLCGWGGLSVQFQTIHLLQSAGLPCRRYLKAKLLQGLVAALLTLPICR